MKDEINRWSADSRSLELDDKQVITALNEVANHSIEYLQYLRSEKAFTSGSFESTAEDKALGLSDQPSELKDALNYVRSRVDKGGISPSNGGHLGYIPGGGMFESAIGDYLANISNRYAGISYASPGAVRMENSLIDWVAGVVGYTEGYGGNLCSGGSIANLIGVNTARHHAGFHSRDTEKQVIYLSKQSHHSIEKAIKICGLHDCKIQFIELDEQFKIDPIDLKRHIEADLIAGLSPFLVVANAGTTDVGAIDPLKEIADLTEKHGLWLHVDAAYGGFFALCDETKPALSGLERANSIVLDPHKGLFLPYGLGIVLVKDIQAMKKAHSFEANYMQDATKYDSLPSPAELSPELTKPFRGLRMWLPLKLHGIAKFKSCLNEKLALASYLHQKLTDLGFECPLKPELSVVVYRLNIPGHDLNQLNKRMHELVLNDGTVFISTTLLNGEFMLRAAILHYRTHIEHIEKLIELLTEFKRIAETS